ncbi:MAG: cysteine desulfurase family protein [Thermodesulfobacteriota bacterium]
MRRLYFDYNATTPLLPGITEAMLPFFTERFGNPGSGHEWGLAAKAATDLARAQVARLLGCAPGNVIFTGCATESNNIVLLGLLPRLSGAHMVVSATEHPAVLEPARILSRRGVGVTVVPVGGDGRADPGVVLAACTPRTRLISVMLANNETGVLNPVAEIAARARERGILVHTDAAQACGKIPVDVKALGADYLSLAGHKMYAPKGVGALYVREGAPLEALSFGGGQEKKVRPGTENVPYLAALGAAAELAGADLAQEEARQRRLGQALLAGLRGLDRDFLVAGEEAPRLPNTAMICFRGLRAGDILSGLAGLEVGVSAGAACHADAESLSHVLAAMRIPAEYARGAVRISWGRPTTEQDAAELVERLGRVLAALN